MGKGSWRHCTLCHVKTNDPSRTYHTQLSFSGCHTSMTAKLPSLIPPFRYAIVEDGLFRGGYPKTRNMRFLKRWVKWSIRVPWHKDLPNHDHRLRLKTILSLIPNKLTPEMHEFCEQHGISMIHINVDKMKEDNIPLSYNKTLMALQVCCIDRLMHLLIESYQ